MAYVYVKILSMKNKILFALISTLCFPIFGQPTSFESRGIGGGGALFSPSINPANPNEMYVSCDMSQTFHTTDRGLHWNEIPFTQIQGGHDGYVSFTKDPLIRYTLHYQSTNGSDFIKPMKSTDQGKTWKVLASDPFSSNPGGYVLRLFADYNNPGHIVLADYGTIQYSSDGGGSFTKIHTNISSGSGNHIAGVFFEGNNIYIGTNDGIIYSTNGGTNFNTMTVSGLSAGEYLLSFAGGKKGSSVKFVCLTTTSVWAGYQYGSNYHSAVKGVYTMDNASGTWTSKTSGIAFGTDYPVFVGMATNCIDTLYLAGGSASSAPIVMRSNAGGSWTHVFKSANNVNIATGWSGTSGDHGWSFPEAPFGFEVDALDAKRVVFSDYSCVHLTSNGGSSWQQRYTDSNSQNTSGTNTPVGKKYQGIGLENTTNWQVMWTDSTHLFSVFSDINGVTSDDKGKSWKFIPNLTQNSVYRILKHTDGNIYAATSSVHDMYQTTRIGDAQINPGKGGIWISKNNGTSFQLLHDFAHPVVWIAIDPSNTDRMYASVLHSNKTSIGGIWVTSNLSAGVNSVWTKLANPPRSNGHPYNITVLKSGNLVVSFSARKPATTFTDSSGVYYYNLAQAKWYDRSHGNMKWYTKDVVVDPNDPTEATWYACVFSAWGSGVAANTGGLYKTTDTGKTWKQISNSYRVDGVTVQKGNADVLYFTTETDGLFYCKNATSVSPTFSLVSAYPFRHPMRVFFNPWKASEIWVTSFGSGMMVNSGSQTNSTEYLKIKNSNTLRIHPNPNTGIFTVTYNQIQTEISQFILFDLTGKEIWHSSKELFPAGSFEKTIKLPKELHGVFILKFGNSSARIAIE